MKLAIGLLALTLSAASASADTIYWSTNPIDTHWGNPNNWVGGRVPTAGDLAVITPGSSPLISGFVRISGLYIQPGAGLVLLSQLHLDGGASIQGNMSIAGQPAVFMHRDDVNLEGRITVWDGGSIERLGVGSGIFSVRGSGSILVPAYDTHGATFGTAMQVDGLIDVRSTHTVSVGAFSSEHNPNSYIALNSLGRLVVSQSASFAATFVPWQTLPYIVNAGTIDISGATSDVTDFAANLAVFNAGVFSTDRPDVVIHNSWDVSNNRLQRGTWACRNYGRVFFDAPAASIGPDASLHLSGWGSALISPAQIENNHGVISADFGATFSTTPATGDFINHGQILLDYAGQVRVFGRFTNFGDGALTTWIAGTASGEHGMVVADSATLGGALNANVVGWYDPAKGDTFLTVSTGQLQGTFSQVTTQYGNATLNAVYDAATMSLVVACPADFNNDGFLDFFDIDAFNACFEGVECPPGRTADYNNDGFVDFFDADAYVADFEAGC